MVNNIIKWMLPYIVEVIIKSVTPEQINKIADQLLDWVEDAIKKSETEIDNQLALPLIAILRTALNIKDNDVVQ